VDIFLCHRHTDSSYAPTSPLSSMSSLPIPSPFQPDCLRGRTAIVTGGGSGIGYEIARQLLRHGCRTVLLCGRRKQFLDDAVRSLRRERIVQRGGGQQPQQEVHGYACDVRNPTQCKAAIEHLATLTTNDDRRSKSPSSSLDILVNGAAGNFLAPAEELTPKGFETVLAIDAMGTFNMTTAAFPLLKNSTCPGGAAVRSKHERARGVVVLSVPPI
jgi:2,4-dienoyl-CoA reductase [(3E)-enoyl-CoA-producing], peroxisomal